MWSHNKKKWILLLLLFLATEFPKLFQSFKCYVFLCANEMVGEWVVGWVGTPGYPPKEAWFGGTNLPMKGLELFHLPTRSFGAQWNWRKSWSSMTNVRGQKPNRIRFKGLPTAEHRGVYNSVNKRAEAHTWPHVFCSMGPFLGSHNKEYYSLDLEYFKEAHSWSLCPHSVALLGDGGNIGRRGLIGESRSLEK